ncbi:hypothetical protein H9636_16060 [Ureibacillus sp. Re31]|uniref:Uncharacterized protein n=1 Tax=Ureibacillus galli TaxID=2762222 RepID=A0ABR8XG13_9BACL|nr:hypothetical protein [Ureibacillus galli]MBD8028163.1 hypothetical protein [Ureibacillus galli]
MNKNKSETEVQILNQIDFVQRFIGRRDMMKILVREQVEPGVYIPIVCNEELQEKIEEVARRAVINELENYQQELFRKWNRMSIK